MNEYLGYDTYLKSLCVLGATIPLELLADVIGRTPFFYLSIPLFAWGMLYIILTIRICSIALPLILMACTYFIGFCGYVIFDGSDVTSILTSPAYKNFVYSFIFIHLAVNKRFKLAIDSYVVGWVIAVLYTYYLFYSGSASTSGARASRINVMINENYHAITIGTGMVICFIRALNEKILFSLSSFLFVVGIPTFLFGVSRTAVLCLVATIILILIYKMLTTFSITMMAKVFLLINFLLVAFIILYYQVEVVSKLTDSLVTRILWTTTGENYGKRDIFFHWGMKLFLQKPILGWGYLGYFNQVGQDPHNGYLKVLVETGLCGFTLYFIALVLITINLKRALKFEHMEEIVFVFIFLCGSALTQQTLEKKMFCFFVSFLIINPYRLFLYKNFSPKIGDNQKFS